MGLPIGATIFSGPIEVLFFPVHMKKTCNANLVRPPEPIAPLAGGVRKAKSTGKSQAAATITLRPLIQELLIEQLAIL